MNNTLKRLGIVALVLGGIGATATTALAYRGDPSVQGPNYTTERHEAMEKAFAEKDYTAWKSLMQGRGRVIEVVNAGNFEKLVAAHELAEAGKITEAKQLRSELGLGIGSGRGNGQGRGAGCNGNR